jgi:hypothetical protein
MERFLLRGCKVNMTTMMSRSARPFQNDDALSQQLLRLIKVMPQQPKTASNRGSILLKCSRMDLFQRSKMPMPLRRQLDDGIQSSHRLDILGLSPPKP